MRPVSTIEFDPFSLEYTADPKPLFARFHREAPLVRHAGLNAWFAHGYEEVKSFFAHPAVGTEAELFQGFAGDPEERARRWPVTERSRSYGSFSDPEAHVRLRKLLAPDFKPTMIRKMAATVQDVVAKHCGPLTHGGTHDVVQLVQSVPLATISRVLGLDESSANAEVFLQAAIYCGVPAAVDSFRLAREVFAEAESETGG